MGSIEPPVPKRPNFLIIVADDLGFSDTSPFGGEISTPTLERIAREGVRLTNFHTASACSPTRSMLFSGTDNHIAGLGQMAEHMKGAPEGTYDGRPGYEGYLNFRVAAMSEIMQDAGYHTIMSGKWHLGMQSHLAPHARGFDKSFVFLPGSGNHYNYEPQHESAPFAKKDWNVWMEDDRSLDRMKDIPTDFYSTKSFTDKLIEYFENRTPTEKTQSFFSFLPFTAPHWPLQAPRETIEKYKGMYDEGPQALRARRLESLKSLGLIPKDVDAAPMTELCREWDTLTPTEKAASARKMEVFSAMVDEVDKHIKRVVDYLESTGELDNTFILFMSDNGAEGALLEALPMMGTNVGAVIDQYYNNSLENIGNLDSFAWYGPDWACASMAPSRGYKTWITEGGIRCPCIVRYPPLAGLTGKHTNTFTTVMDILPTILELADIPQPGKMFRSRAVAPIRGNSWIPHLKSGGLVSVHDETFAVTGWELFGNRAIRQGKWKAVWMGPPRGKDRWELYDMDADPGEVHDLAEVRTDILDTLVEHWETYYTETGMYDAGYVFPITKI